MKLRILVVVGCFITLTCTCFAQDVIVTKDARKINAKVTEVNLSDIKYKNFDNMDGPTYTLLKSDIASILYQNGQVETFETGNTPNQATSPPPVQTQQGNSNFMLKKSHNIIIDADAMGRKPSNRICNLLEQQFRKLGFCCVFRKTNENESTANIVVVVHPGGISKWAFRMHDKTLDKEMYYKIIVHSVNFNNTTGKFINDIVPLIER